MRIFVILIILLTGITIDAVTKYYFNTIAWTKYCYTGSSYIVPQSDRYSGACSKEIYTSESFPYFVKTNTYVPVISDIVGFQLSYNSGIAFSLPLKGKLLQIGTIFVILSVILYYIVCEWKKNMPLIDIGFACIISGAISHAYERIFIGHVIDFIYIKYFAILNFADILISIGTVFFILGYLAYENRGN